MKRIARSNLSGTKIRRIRNGRANAAIVIVAALLVTGCDVTNPGPVQDEFLNDPTSHAALVNGSRQRLLFAANDLFYMTATVSRELMPGGNTGNYGFDVQVLFGALPFDEEQGSWNDLQQARFIAEDAIRRFVDEGAIPASERDSSDILAGAYVWAGFANKILGEYSCEAVFDGGPAEPFIRHLERAEQQFSEAITIASSSGNDRLLGAALGGRAQVAMWLGDWDAAVSDAQRVQAPFEFVLPVDEATQNTFNGIYFGSAGSPYRSHSAWMTYQYTYYPDTGDPRASWEEDPDNPFANSALPGYGQIPYVNQTKYTSNGDPYPLVKWQEMRLIEAEALLVSGEWEDAMDVINGVRTSYVSDGTGQPLGPWTATSLEDAWRYLKRERGIELWLEGRRLGDMRRWEEQNTPGDLELPDWKATVSSEFKDPPDLCHPIPETERVTNPNIPDTP